jgi:lysophospholipase L1-like esterase
MTMRCLLALAVGLLLAACSSGSPADPQRATGSPGPADTGVYVALGDSLAAGMQPGRGDVRGTAYPAVVGAGLGAHVENLGCSGETTVSLVEGGLCRYPEGSQLRTAEAVLRKGRVHLVTLDIGANDALWCAAPDRIDEACLAEGLDQVRSTLPGILQRLRSAAGPDTPIVVLTYYNPFVAWSRTGADPARIAEGGRMMGALNDVLRAEAKSAGASVVGMEVALHGADTSETVVDGERMPRNVAEICRATFACTRSDIHLTDTGARTIGEAILAAMR